MVRTITSSRDWLYPGQGTPTMGMTRMKPDQPTTASTAMHTVCPNTTIAGPGQRMSRALASSARSNCR